MSENAEADKAHAISRISDSGEQAVRELVALPLRMFAGTLGVFEAVLRTAADKLREMKSQWQKQVKDVTTPIRVQIHRQVAFSFAA